MKSINTASTNLEERVTELARLKNAGKKIVGYVCNGFMPEELVWASGAIPVGLNKGGDYDAVLKSTEYVPRFFDTFSRSQIGYWALEDPLYRLPDLFVVPSTDKNIEVIAACWEMWTETKVFKFGVPHNIDSEHAFHYYLEGLHLLKEELENLTGEPITDAKLKKEIDSSNMMRRLLYKINETRKSPTPPISGKDFIELNHTTLYADKDSMIVDLESLSKELEAKTGEKKPRILIIGSTLAQGNEVIYDVIESTGADVVSEDFSEGLRTYRGEVSVNGDLLASLAEYYFLKKQPLPAFFRPATEKRADFLFNLARDYQVNGIIWYSMLYREAYDIEGMYFSFRAEKEGFPFIKIGTDYNPAEDMSLQTRIGAFIESMATR